MTLIPGSSDLNTILARDTDSQSLTDIYMAVGRYLVDHGTPPDFENGVASAGDTTVPAGTNVYALTGSTGPGQVDKITTPNRTFIEAGSNGGNVNVQLDPATRGDTLQAGSGNDTLTSNSGANGQPTRDHLWAGTGADTINAGGASDVAGNGLSTINAGRFAGSHDTVYAGVSGNGAGDTISLTQGDNLVYSATNAVVTAGSGLDTIVGGGSDTINGGGSTEIYATNKDTINTQGSDTVIGGQEDTINSAGGSATLLIGQGNQHLNLSNGANDSVFGGVASPTSGTVIVNEAFGTSSQTTDSNGFTHISFQDGTSLTASHVDIKFTDDPTKHSFS